MWNGFSARRAERFVLAAVFAALAAACQSVGISGDGALLYGDNFDAGLGNWVIEAERPGHISASGGVLDIDVPAGVTLWFRHHLQGPVAIEYEVTPVAEGGPNDAVSDVNAFWMASDTRASSGNVLELRRSGAFADYDELRTYYSSIGGNRNTTTRFRRYVGRKSDRPLLPEHDLTAPEHLLQPNRPTRVRLVSDGGRIEMHRDGRLLFRYDDPKPYSSGHFAIRTTKSHLRLRRFSVRALRR